MYSDVYTCLHVKYPLVLSDLNKTEISRQFFEKCANVKFNGNPSNGRRVFPCGRTEGYVEASSRFSKFYERALKLQKFSESATKKRKVHTLYFSY
jgi:hypothetical protein